MAARTYDRRWKDAMADLHEHIQIEDPSLGGNDDNAKEEAPPSASIQQAFQHFACLYIHYIQILQRLCQCYDQMLHPQKRIDVKQVLEMVATRVIELKHDLVKWHPLNPDVQTVPERSFPWEYVNLDSILVDLRLPPQNIEIPISTAIIDDHLQDVERRDRLIRGHLKSKHGVDRILIQEAKEAMAPLLIQEAISVIQRNERGRQGRERGLLVQEFINGRRLQQSSRKLDPDTAATAIQRIFRGWKARMETHVARNEELMFLGMKAVPLSEQAQALRKARSDAKILRQNQQAENKEEYEKALLDLHKVVLDEEGPFMKEKMLEDRRQWIAELMTSGQLPVDLVEFYKSQEQALDISPIDKVPKEKSQDFAASQKLPPLTNPSQMCSNLYSAVRGYENVWANRQNINDFYQKYDVSLAKDVVRGPVEDQVRQEIDAMLVLQLANIKMQLELASKRKKSKPIKASKKKPTKTKIKSKPLPGDKLSDLKNGTLDSFLSLLIEQRIIQMPSQNVHVHDFIGSFNILGTIYERAECRDRMGNYSPQDPSPAQIRQLITEYAVFPLASSVIRANTTPIRSILLYGPKGCGKTMMVNAIANETRAMILNLSPRNLETKFTDKNGPVRLMHSVFMLAKNASFQPVIIYLDQCELYFAASVKSKKDKASADGFMRFSKDLITYAKATMEPHDRILILGTTSDPCKGQVNDMRQFFDKCLYLSYPDYASRALLWTHAIACKLHENTLASAQDLVDLSSLAHISEGYASSSIIQAVNQTLTPRRLACLHARPLREQEFLGPLSHESITFADEYEKLKDFTAAITGLKQVREEIRKQANDALTIAADAKGSDKTKSKQKPKK